MRLRTGVGKAFCVLSIGLAAAGCGEGPSDSGPAEPNIGPGAPAGAKATFTSKKTTKPADEAAPAEKSEPAKK